MVLSQNARPQPGTGRIRRAVVTGGAGFLGSYLCEAPVAPWERGLERTVAWFRALAQSLAAAS